MSKRNSHFWSNPGMGDQLLVAVPTFPPYNSYDTLGQLSLNILPEDKGLLQGHHPGWSEERPNRRGQPLVTLSGPQTLLLAGAEASSSPWTQLPSELAKPGTRVNNQRTATLSLPYGL